jgi:DNA-binding GntR family transcriptional regulator
MEWEPDVPRWRQIYAIVEERIADGTYPPGSQLPGVLALTTEFGVAQMTARRVLTELRAAGLAQMQPGVGTFVTELPKPDRSG